MSRESKISVTSGGVSLSTILTAAFIVLKILGFIDWSWFWVLAPLWISFAFLFLIFFVSMLIMYFVNK